MDDEILVTIAGAGVVGCAIAYELSTVLNGNIVVVERNNSVKGENQSSRNSGVIHAGIFYDKSFGSLKSRFCVEGNRMLYEFCEKNKVPYKKCGKLVVATSKLEEEYLEDVIRIAHENGVEGIKVLDKKQVKEIEPNINAVSAIHVPSSGIVEPTGLVEAFYRLAEDNGVIFLTSNEVKAISPDKKGGFEIEIRSDDGNEKFNTRIFINSAGLYSDDVAKMLNPGSIYNIEPVKGEAAKFFPSRHSDINISGASIYPVPFGYLPDGERLNVPFKEFLSLFKQHKVTKSVGVHISPTFDTAGTFMIGPAYSKPENRQDYKPSRREEYFLEKVLPFLPGIKPDDVSLYQVGIRAKLKDHYDFVIERDRDYPAFINLIGIDSPGLTSSPAIAKYVSGIARDTLR